MLDKNIELLIEIDSVTVAFGGGNNKKRNILPRIVSELMRCAWQDFQAFP